MTHWTTIIDLSQLKAILEAKTIKEYDLFILFGLQYKIRTGHDVYPSQTKDLAQFFNVSVLTLRRCLKRLKDHNQITIHFDHCGKVEFYNTGTLFDVPSRKKAQCPSRFTNRSMDNYPARITAGLDQFEFEELIKMNVTPREFMLYLALKSYGEECYAGSKAISRRIGYSISKVNDILCEMKKKGIVKYQVRLDNVHLVDKILIPSRTKQTDEKLYNSIIQDLARNRPNQHTQKSNNDFRPSQELLDYLKHLNEMPEPQDDVNYHMGNCTDYEQEHKKNFEKNECDIVPNRPPFLHKPNNKTYKNQHGNVQNPKHNNKPLKEAFKTRTYTTLASFGRSEELVDVKEQQQPELKLINLTDEDPIIKNLILLVQNGKISVSEFKIQVHRYVEKSICELLNLTEQDLNPDIEGSEDVELGSGPKRVKKLRGQTLTEPRKGAERPSELFASGGVSSGLESKEVMESRAVRSKPKRKRTRKTMSVPQDQEAVPRNSWGMELEREMPIEYVQSQNWIYRGDDWEELRPRTSGSFNNNLDPDEFIQNQQGEVIRCSGEDFLKNVTNETDKKENGLSVDISTFPLFVDVDGEMLDSDTTEALLKVSYSNVSGRVLFPDTKKKWRPSHSLKNMVDFCGRNFLWLHSLLVSDIGKSFVDSPSVHSTYIHFLETMSRSSKKELNYLIMISRYGILNFIDSVHKVSYAIDNGTLKNKDGLFRYWLEKNREKYTNDIDDLRSLDKIFPCAAGRNRDQVIERQGQHFGSVKYWMMELEAIRHESFFELDFDVDYFIYGIVSDYYQLVFLVNTEYDHYQYVNQMGDSAARFFNKDTFLVHRVEPSWFELWQKRQYYRENCEDDSVCI